jgi:hypothetical protein
LTNHFGRETLGAVRGIELLLVRRRVVDYMTLAGSTCPR